MPLTAKYTFHGGAGLYGMFLSALGVGSILGGLLVARQGEQRRRTVVAIGVAVAVGGLAAALAPTIALEVVALVGVGVAGSAFIAVLSARLQIHTPTAVRGRVTALWMIAAVGTRPIFAPLVGAVGQHLGARYAIGMAPVVLLVLALPLWWVLSVARPPDNEKNLFRNRSVSIKVAD